MTIKKGSTSQLNQLLEHIGSQFKIQGKFGFGEVIGSGHIHDTYLVHYHFENRIIRYVHQKINDFVFNDPIQLMENVTTVTQHQFKEIRAVEYFDPERAVLHLVPALNGRNFYHDSKGKFWRTFDYIENAYTCNKLNKLEQAQEAAMVFGRFQKTMTTLPPGKLHEIIPGFHDTCQRLSLLEQSIEEDSLNRANECSHEIDFSQKQKAIASIIKDLINKGDLPNRVIHNDTKINNVMFDQDTHKGLCVIDLDTVMPGTVLYDFGDLVRSAGNSAADDEKDLNKVSINMPVFKALIKGYLTVARDFLTNLEIEYLVFSPKLLAFELGIRFLTDYLKGDIYFKTKYPDHNLNRCRTQFKLFESIKENEKQMRKISQEFL